MQLHITVKSLLPRTSTDLSHGEQPGTQNKPSRPLKDCLSSCTTADMRVTRHLNLTARDFAYLLYLVVGGGWGEYMRFIFFSGTGDFIFSPAGTLEGCSQLSSRSMAWSKPYILCQVIWPWGQWGCVFCFTLGRCLFLHITRVSLKCWAGCVDYVREDGAKVPWCIPMTWSHPHSRFPLSLSYVITGHVSFSSDFDGKFQNVAGAAEENECWGKHACLVQLQRGDVYSVAVAEVAAAEEEQRAV